MNPQFTNKNGLIRLAITLLILFSTCLHAETKEFECDLKASGLSHHLSVTQADGNLTNFDYVAVSILNQGPPYPSCSIAATTLGKKAKRSTWDKKASTISIHLNKSADPNDQIIIRENKTGYFFDFSGVSPMNCGASSGIAEKITIKFTNKKCQVHQLRN